MFHGFWVDIQGAVLEMWSSGLVLALLILNLGVFCSQFCLKKADLDWPA